MIEVKAFKPRGRRTYLEQFSIAAEAHAREAQLKSWGYCVTVTELELPPKPTKAQVARKAKARKNLERIRAERLAGLKPAIAAADAAAAKARARLSRQASRLGRALTLRAVPQERSCYNLHQTPAWHYRAELCGWFGQGFFRLMFVEASLNTSDLEAAVAFIEQALGKIELGTHKETR